MAADAPHVLVAEDDPDIRELIELKLEMIGLSVESVADGPAALAAAERRPADLVLLDVRMPRMDGFEVCRRLRATPQYADTPVVMITGLVADHHAASGLRAGATEYLVKPFSPREMVHHVVGVIHRHYPTLELPPRARALIA
jgi:two-component system, OmpR family, phosphate regulon response regulator PhoB